MGLALLEFGLRNVSREWSREVLSRSRVIFEVSRVMILWGLELLFWSRVR